MLITDNENATMGKPLPQLQTVAEGLLLTASGRGLSRRFKRAWTGEPTGDVSTAEDATVEKLKEAVPRILAVANCG